MYFVLLKNIFFKNISNTTSKVKTEKDKILNWIHSNIPEDYTKEIKAVFKRILYSFWKSLEPCWSYFSVSIFTIAGNIKRISSLWQASHQFQGTVVSSDMYLLLLFFHFLITSLTLKWAAGSWTYLCIWVTQRRFNKCTLSDPYLLQNHLCKSSLFKLLACILGNAKIASRRICPGPAFGY